MFELVLDGRCSEGTVHVTYSVFLFNHLLYNDVLVLDVYNTGNGLHLSPHQRGAKNNTKITGLHQVHARLLSNTV